MLEVALPFTSREAVHLSRDGDELLLQVDGLRRTIVLPRALVDAPTAGAKMEDGVLRIQFKGRADGGTVEAWRSNMTEPRERRRRPSKFVGAPGHRRRRGCQRPARSFAWPSSRSASHGWRASRPLKERGRRMIDRVMPPEAGQHFRNAGREQLLGVRSIVDFWIRRIDDAESRSRGTPLGRRSRSTSRSRQMAAERARPQGGMDVVILGFDIGTALTPDVSVLETIIRGVFMYLAIFVLLRVILRGRTSAVSVSDLLVLVLISDAAQNAMAADYLSITSGLVLVSTIVLTSFVMDWLAFRFVAIRRFVHPEHKPLVVDGRVLRKALADELMTEEELMTQLRLNGVEDAAEVKAAYLEGNGAISVIRLEQGGGTQGAQQAARRRV